MGLVEPLIIYINYFEETVKTVSKFAALILESFSIVVIVSAALKEAFEYLKKRFREKSHRSEKNIRINFAKTLVVALEFLLAADILKTIAAPGWASIGEVATIAALR